MCTRGQREDHGVARRADTILLLDDGKSWQSITEFLYLNDDIIRGWYKIYHAGGWGCTLDRQVDGRSVPHDAGTKDRTVHLAG